VLFDKIVEGMVSVAGADYGWLLLRDERTRAFVLAAHHNLPDSWASKMGQLLDDGISSLVALSGETLAISGEPLEQFKVASLGSSAVVVPIKVQQEVIGLLVIVRKKNQAFEKTTQSLLEAVADYASISLVNARLFRAFQESAEAARAGEKEMLAKLQELRQDMHSLLHSATYPIELLLTGKMGKLTAEQKEALETVQASLQHAVQLVAAGQVPKVAAKMMKK